MSLLPPDFGLSPSVFESSPSAFPLSFSHLDSPTFGPLLSPSGLNIPEAAAFSFSSSASLVSALSPPSTSVSALLGSLGSFASNRPALTLGLVALALVLLGLLIRWLLGRADEAAQPDLEQEVSLFEAIKAYRQRYGVSLKDARQAIMKLPPRLLRLGAKGAEKEGAEAKPVSNGSAGAKEGEREEPEV